MKSLKPKEDSSANFRKPSNNDFVRVGITILEKVIYFKFKQINQFTNKKI